MIHEDITPGKYQHFKGGEYEVIGVANHSETLEKLVLYRALYTSEKFGENALWARPLELFTDTVTLDGGTVQRFKKI
ncbi:MAG: DUF1653 domain-containing protein, partial [Candidatus Pacebacteria bacterium]|nr:DUF1653 domain-containing protein [Candidatus Paceibacterota bacterium]